MSFIIRSLFWLTVAFLVVAPHATDFGASAERIKAQGIAVAADVGEQLVLEHMLGKRYSSTALLDPETRTRVVPAETPAGFVTPRPRPAALG